MRTVADAPTARLSGRPLLETVEATRIIAPEVVEGVSVAFELPD
jgi:hypothetical protein